MIRARLASADELPRCLAVRRVVFIDEQGVAEDIEVDGRDAEATHFIAEDDDGVIGAARLREVHGEAKAERVAVLRSARGRGVGTALMAALEAEAARRGLAAVVLGAQEQAIPFYERIGYRVFGAAFLDADIPHRWMRKRLGVAADGGA